MVFDPRTISKPAYEHLYRLRDLYETALSTGQINEAQLRKHLQEQKSEAVQLYSYISTWGLMRLKGEEISLDQWDNENPPTLHQRATKSQEGRREIIEAFFNCLQEISTTNHLSGNPGLETLIDRNHNDYLGLTGLALTLAQEFSFWADAVYHDIRTGE